MRKIYIVVADNGRDYEDHYWWNVASFTSIEMAQTFIETLTAELLASQRRLEELEIKTCDGYELTEDEEKEFERAQQLAEEYWDCYDNDKFRFLIEEKDLHE